MGITPSETRSGITGFIINKSGFDHGTWNLELVLWNFLHDAFRPPDDSQLHQGVYLLPDQHPQSVYRRRSVHPYRRFRREPFRTSVDFETHWLVLWGDDRPVFRSALRGDRAHGRGIHRGDDATAQ